MTRKCFISFKTEDIAYKDHIQNHLSVDMIDKSMNEPIISTDDAYIMRKIREDYLADSTVTIFLIGLYSNENLGAYEQNYIKRELQASLYNGTNNTRNGVLGVVLPSIYEIIYKGTNNCSICGGNHNIVDLVDSTVIKEFSYNYYIPNNKCCHEYDEKYCVLVKWDDFVNNPEIYIEQAFDKRTDPIANKVKVYP